MKFYYVTEYDSYQRKTRHFFFSEEPIFVSGRWQEKPSYLTKMCPSFVEIKEELIPSNILQARQTTPNDLVLMVKCNFTTVSTVKSVGSNETSIPELLIG